MKTVRTLAFAVLSVLSMSTSCEKQDREQPGPCSAGPVPIIETPGLTTDCRRGSLANIGDAEQYVINSAAEYRAAFSCAPEPAVDFSKYTLLAGKTKTSTGRYIASQAVTAACPGYVYTVKLGPGLTQALTEVGYYAVVPKIPAGAPVRFDVQLLP